MSVIPEPQRLSRVLQRARRALALNFPDPIWLRAELSEVSERRGHRYLQLVEKGDHESTVARVGGVVWSRDYRAVLRKRGEAAAEVLTAGQAVVVQVTVDFHEVYGLKLVVVDWDPAFTLGQLELRRREIVADLLGRRLLRRNAALTLPLVVQRIAVVTSARAAGYADFDAQLAANSQGYRFETTLFDVSVQGEQTETSVADALSQIASRADAFDAIALLRGGGSRLDLASFDRLGIGEAIASCPIPVLSGIGHETDETLPDLVAHTSLKTPTALAEYIIERATRFEAGLLATAREIVRRAERVRARRSEILQRFERDVAFASSQRLQREYGSVLQAEERLAFCTHAATRRHAERLDALESHLSTLDPRAVLSRGFALVSRGGSPIGSAEVLRSGDRILTQFNDGAVESTVS